MDAIEDVDLSETVFDQSKSNISIIDSNGQKYIAGDDTHEWFSITMVELHPAPEDSDYEQVAYPVGEFPTHSFNGKGKEELIELLSHHKGL